MRIVFIGGGELTQATARILIERGHDIVIVESSRECIDDMSADLDCAFLHGDGARPDVLAEVAPEETDLIFCLTGNDKDNLIASLVARSLEFSKIITRIHNPDFAGICSELGLENVIVPDQTFAHLLADMVNGVDVLELSQLLRDEARLFRIEIGEGDTTDVAGLELPDDSRAICLYRDDKFQLPDDSTKLRDGDEVVLITRECNLAELRERWQPPTSDDE